MHLEPCSFLYKVNRHARALARSLLKLVFMPHAKSRLAMELWCHAVDTLLAKGSSFADALDGANVILQAYKRQNDGDQAGETGADEREQQTSSFEPADEILAGMRQSGAG